MKAQLQSLFTMVRWEMLRMRRSQGTTKRALFGLVLVLSWLVLTGVLMRWMLEWPLLVLLLPVFPLVSMFGYIGDSFAGERERSTLEALLLSPVPDWAIMCSKVIALMLVSLLMCSVLLLAHSATTHVLGMPGLPVRWYALALGVGTIIYTSALCAGVTISWHTTSVQATQHIFANVITAVCIAAMGYMLLPEAVTRLLQRIPLVVAAIAGVGVALGSLVLAIGMFHRDRLLLR